MILTNQEVQDILSYLGKQPYELSSPLVQFFSNKIEQEKAQSEKENKTNNQENG